MYVFEFITKSLLNGFEYIVRELFLCYNGHVIESDFNPELKSLNKPRPCKKVVNFCRNKKLSIAVFSS